VFDVLCLERPAEKATQSIKKMPRLMGCYGASVTAALNISPRHQCIRLIARSGDDVLVDVVALATGGLR
jgi:hypothetical protein